MASLTFNLLILMGDTVLHLKFPVTTDSSDGGWDVLSEESYHALIACLDSFLSLFAYFILPFCYAETCTGATKCVWGK